MREIKFRVWTAWGGKIKEMYYDYIYSDEDGFHYKLIIMQYIGLRDKQGREIYEGDIVEYDNDNYWCGRSDGCPPTYKVVVPNIESFYENSDHPDIGLDLTVQRGLVIGNIYENPELLKG